MEKRADLIFFRNGTGSVPFPVGMLEFLRCYKWSLLTFAAICALGYFARTSIGHVYGAAEAITLIDALSRAGLYLGSAIATASATIIALMLTMIGMIRRMDEDFDAVAYQNIVQIARLATASLLISLVLLMAFSLPTGEFDQMPAQWFETLYEIMFLLTVIMVGLSAATVILIYTTLHRVLGKITPGKDV